MNGPGVLYTIPMDPVSGGPYWHFTHGPLTMRLFPSGGNASVGFFVGNAGASIYTTSLAYTPGDMTPWTAQGNVDCYAHGASWQYFVNGSLIYTYTEPTASQSRRAWIEQYQFSAVKTFGTAGQPSVANSNNWPVDLASTWNAFASTLNTWARFAHPSGHGVVTGNDGAQYLARNVIDTSKAAGSRAETWAYYRNSDDDDWVKLAGWLLLEDDQQADNDPSPSLQMCPYSTVNRDSEDDTEGEHLRVQRGERQLDSLDLGDNWTERDPDDYTLRPGGWVTAMLASRAAQCQARLVVNVSGAEYIDALAYPHGKVLTDFTGTGQGSPPSTEARPTSQAGCRPYPFLWDFEDASRLRCGSFCGGYYKEWDLDPTFVDNDQCAFLLAHESESDIELLNAVIWTSAHDTTQMLVGFDALANAVVTLYRVGSSGAWGDVRASWSVPLATVPYCYHRDDGAWEVGWLDTDDWSWTQYRCGNPAASEADWELVT